MKYDITKRQLSPKTKALIQSTVGKRGNSSQLIHDVEEALKVKRPRKEWELKVASARRVKEQAKSFLNTIEGLRPEFKRLVNHEITASVLTANYNQLLDRDWIGILEVFLSAHINGTASKKLCVGNKQFEVVKSEYSYSKSDLPSLNIIDQLAEAWKKNTRLTVSYADGSPFVEFVTMVINDTSKKSITDPRRIIKLMLKHSPNLKRKK